MKFIMILLLVVWGIELVVVFIIIHKEDNGFWFVKNRIKEIFGIKDRLYKCEYCGIYTYPQVVTKGLPLFEKHELHFCSGECKGLWIDMQLPVEARRYEHE